MNSNSQQKTGLQGETVTLTIDRLAYGGDGVAHYEGKVIFVPWSAPGDVCEVEIVQDHSRFARGAIVKLLKASPERVEPRCSVFGVCGGCQWQHIAYAAQVRHKAEIFRETLCHLGGFKDPPIEAMIPADQIWDYRNRIQIKVNGSGHVGFHAQGSHRVVEFDYCHIAHPHLNAVLAEGRIFKHDVELVWDEAGDRVLIHRPERASFLQIHPKQNERLIRLVQDYVQPQSTQSLAELYCGNGNFSLPLAPQVRALFAVDQNETAIGQAHRKSQEAGLKHVQFVVGSAEWGLKRIQRQSMRPDSLILDPPRGGAKEILDLLVLLAIPKLVYISCDPASLARDLKFLTRHGYQLKRTRPLDMFPQTYHIESVSELRHG